MNDKIGPDGLTDGERENFARARRRLRAYHEDEAVTDPIEPATDEEIEAVRSGDRWPNLTVVDRLIARFEQIYWCLHPEDRMQILVASGLVEPGVEIAQEEERRIVDALTPKKPRELPNLISGVWAGDLDTDSYVK